MKKNAGKKFLADLKLYSDYLKWLPFENRYETWIDASTDIINGHKLKYKNDILNPYLDEVLGSLIDKKVFASQRNLQYRYEQIIRSNLRMYNCTSTHAMRNKVFQEVFYLALNGCGVGVGLLIPFVKNISKIAKRTNGTKTYVINDSIEGWADALGVLMSSYFVDNQPFPEYAGYEIKFDGSNIREKGSFISGGFKAPGYEPLKTALEKIELLLEQWIDKEGSELRPIAVGDIICHSSNAVLSGGVRRAALNFIVDPNDQEMILSKTGDWYSTNKQRERTNNSILLLRSAVTKEQFEYIVNLNNGMNDIGFVFANSWLDMFNPCFTGDMKLLTSEGYKPFKELKEGDVYKFVNLTGQEVNGYVKLTGYKPVVDIHLTTGKIISSTSDHKFMTLTEEECEARNLKGKQLKFFLNYNKKFNQDYVKYGFLQGDGGLGRLSSSSHKGLEIFLNEKDTEIAKLFNIPVKQKTYINGYNDILNNLGFSDAILPNRILPKSIDTWNDLEIQSFLRGLWSANGSVITNSRISFKSTCKELIEGLNILLNKYNISSYYTTNKAKKTTFSNGEYLCKESYDLNICKYESMVEFFNLIGFEQKYKTQSLIKLLTLKSPKVTKIVPRKGLEPVYDFELDDMTHWGVVEGVIAHNCYEISKLPILYNGDVSLIKYNDLYDFVKTNSHLFGVQGCNLNEILAEKIKTKEDFIKACYHSTILGTCQAGYTKFPYLGPITEQIFEREALLGISIIGWMNNPILFNPEWLEEGAKVVKETNKLIANIIGINPAARTTCVKPGGNSSVIGETIGGISAEEAEEYLRHMQINKENTIAKYLEEHFPEMIEDSVHSDSGTDYVITVPIKVPDGALLKKDIMGVKHLELIKLVQTHWVLPGTNPDLCVYNGINHNVSCTVIVENDKTDVINYIWDNKESFTAISFLSSFGSRSWNQAPLTEIVNLEDIVKKYGTGALFASGLIVDGLHYYNNDLWKACDSLIDKTIPIVGTKDQVLLKKYWLERAKKFSKNYFKNNLNEMIACLKDVYILHKWEKTIRSFKEVDFSKVLTQPEYKDISDYASVACAGGACEIPSPIK